MIYYMHECSLEIQGQGTKRKQSGAGEQIPWRRSVQQCYWVEDNKKLVPFLNAVTCPWQSISTTDRLGWWFPGPQLEPLHGNGNHRSWHLQHKVITKFDKGCTIRQRHWVKINPSFTQVLVEYKSLSIWENFNWKRSEWRTWQVKLIFQSESQPRDENAMHNIPITDSDKTSMIHQKSWIAPCW